MLCKTSLSENSYALVHGFCYVYTMQSRKKMRFIVEQFPKLKDKNRKGDYELMFIVRLIDGIR